MRVSRLIRYLYSPSELERFRAAEKLGELCRGRIAREMILRLFWHLSDESGAYCIGAPLGIAEIGRNNPDEFEGFKNRYVSLLENWEVERKYVAYGIYRTAEIVRDAYPNPAELLRKISSEEDATFAAYAILALKALGESFSDIVAAFGDRVVRIYFSGRIIDIRVRDVAKLDVDAPR